MLVIGVRSSWLTEDTKASLTTSTSRIRSRAARSASSVSIRSVTSSEVLT